MIARRQIATATIVLVATSVVLHAHSGPPFPILSDQIAGPYRVSIWTDPDTTDDGSPGGQFWVKVERAPGDSVPDKTQATVTIRPLDRAGPEVAGTAAPVRGDAGNQFAALLMDHEGRFAVHVTIDGPLGPAAVNATVEATYDLRPPRALLFLYLVPFVLVGLLWGRLLIRRRRASVDRQPLAKGKQE
jgi:hypothetical protein